MMILDQPTLLRTAAFLARGAPEAAHTQMARAVLALLPLLDASEGFPMPGWITRLIRARDNAREMIPKGPSR